MEVLVNGERKIISSSNVAELIQELDLTQRKIALELNKEVVSRSSYENTPLKPGDEIEVVHFVGGG